MPLSRPTGISESAPQVAVVIATRNREAELANRALRSVVGQTRLPDYLVVVDDSHPRHRDANRRIVDGVTLPVGRPMRVRYLHNSRTPGASGAWNDGLDWLHRQVADPDGILVAILDDDDEWKPDYLAGCAREAKERGLDMVAADIIRHEGANDPGRVQPAPDVLCAKDFLVRNPGIQGSNLFVRLGTLLAAGLFDEALPSTTDRDLCIRLADLGFVRYGRLARPLVHHFADGDRPRLSTPSSAPKLEGLDGFYRKYHHRMIDAERTAFAARADALFGWRPPANPAPTVARAAAPAPPATRRLSLVVGMTTSSATGPAQAALLQDLTGLLNDPRLGNLEIALLENGPRASDGGRDLASVAQALRERGIQAVLVPLERQALDAAEGVFGQPFDRGAGRVSIAVARTMLQTYLYLWARRRPRAAVWILDDDMRLDNLIWRGGPRVERAPLDIVGTVSRLRDSGVAIAIGTCTEAPPLPFASCVRTQLVDTWHNLELLATLGPDDPFPELLSENMATRARYSDYYYDLSRRETDQLETPFWYVPDAPGRTAGDALAEIVERLPRILAGEEVFRPLVQDASIDPLAHLQPSVHRGGNAFVFDIEALWDFPNGVPSIAGGDTRRSDMVWSLLNRYGARRTVVKVPLPVRQHRGHVDVQQLDLDKLVRDIHGYAIYSALDDLLLDRCERSHLAGDGHVPDDLNLDEAEVAFTIRRFRKYVDERLYAFQLSFHRAAGLARSLERYLDERGGWWWLRDARYADVRERLRATILLFRHEYDLGRLPAFRERVVAVNDQIVRDWLDTLRAEIRARRTMNDAVHGAAAWLDEERARNAAARVVQAFGSRELRQLGSGAEGVVLTDGTAVFKCIDTGMEAAQIDFLRSQLGRWNGLRTLYCLDDLRVTGRTVILTYRHEVATPYRGGHGGTLRLLLDECRAAGIVCTNVHPDNLIVTTSGEVKLVDYGADIRPFTENDWLLMARRAWLAGRHADRPDLKDLMRRSLEDGNLPELDRLDAFLRVDPCATKETLLDARLQGRILGLRPGSVFDYGCGKGQLAAALARAGIAATAYDPDPALAPRWEAHGTDAQFLSPAGLAGVLASGQQFEVVVCGLVLCVVEDDAELVRVIGDLARLVTPGGRVIVTVCNPDSVGRSTLLQHRDPPPNRGTKCVTWKTLRATGVRRRDVHRPRPVLLRAFAEFGLHVETTEETASIDPDTLEPSSDFLILHFRSDGRGA